MRRTISPCRKQNPIGPVMPPRLPQAGLIRTYNTLQHVSIGFL